MEIPYYLKIGKASDLEIPKERKIYRFLEILPGLASWTTLILVVLFSWLIPVWTSVFVICFVVYWLVRSFYFSFHLNSCYKRMRENEKIDWMKKVKEVDGWKNIYHLVVIAMYKEPLEIIRESFLSLADSDWPNNKIIVVLSYEEKGGEKSEKTAEAIKEEFGENFFKILIVKHPFGLKGEISGKGANESWGMKKAKQEIIDPLKIPFQNIIASSFDADTRVFSKYFSILAYRYLTIKDSLRCSFQPIPLFINNIWQSPPISRIFSFSASFWQMMCQERPEKLITFSSHSMSFKTLVAVGFRQTNVVSDDSRIFWQSFLKYKGDYRVVPLYYPISMDANCAPKFIETMKNVYKQQRRWAYGAGEIAYSFFGFMKVKGIPLTKKISLGGILFEAHWSWATSSIVIFMLGWLPLILGGERFGQTLLAYNLPVFVSRILTIAMLGLVGSAYLSIFILPPKPPEYGKKKYIFFVLEWFLLPFVMIFFTSLPALDAQTRLMLGKYMGFWSTPKIRK